jgi:N-acetylneuraminic acid mutarotase
MTRLGISWAVVPPLYAHGTAHTATLMKDGRVLVVGGCIGSGICTQRVEIFNPYTNAWMEVKPLESDRAEHTAVLLDDGRVLVVGGTKADGGASAGGDALLYDPQTNTWTATGSMVNPRYLAQSVRLADGRVLVAGGMTLKDKPVQTISTSAEIYDPASNTWTAAADLAQARYAYVLALLPGGQALAIGGARDYDARWSAGSFVGEIEVYDPVAHRWHTAGALPRPGANAAAAFLPDGRLWVTGGQAGQSGATFWSDTWLIAALPRHP